MKAAFARLLALIAVIEGLIAIVVKLADATILDIAATGFLRAASVTLLLAIFFILDDLRDQYQRTHGA